MEGIHSFFRPKSWLCFQWARICRGTRGLGEGFRSLLREKGLWHSGTRNLLAGHGGLLPGFRSALGGRSGRFWAVGLQKRSWFEAGRDAGGPRKALRLGDGRGQGGPWVGPPLQGFPPA